MTHTCGSCEYWVHNAAVRAAPNVGHPGGGELTPSDTRIGECHANPPTVHLLPIQTLDGRGQAISPQPLRPMTFASARACRHYPFDLGDIGMELTAANEGLQVVSK